MRSPADSSLHARHEELRAALESANGTGALDREVRLQIFHRAMEFDEVLLRDDLDATYSMLAEVALGSGVDDPDPLDALEASLATAADLLEHPRRFTLFRLAVALVGRHHADGVQYSYDNLVTLVA